MISRRDLIVLAGQSWLASGFVPLASTVSTAGPSRRTDSVRCINVVNFLRGVEPRGPVDLFLPLRKQMEVILRHRLPATWLLQFDALVSGPFVEYIKAHAPDDHEVGVWFEMNEMHCKAAGVEWRGRPGYEWDHLPSVAFTIGYTPEERIRLADAFMSEFKKVWGRHPRSVASWNLDSFTMAHLCDRYGIDAFAVCRDQIATDGFTIWGAPIAGYYPSKTNCWSPALSRDHQLPAPVFRMLGQDPVYYFENGYPMPNGVRGGGPDTMEPVWPSGRSPVFIRNFLRMVAESPSLEFAYAQLGQENSFGWTEMEDAYPRQIEALRALREAGSVHVETMGATGRRFKREFGATPAQSQVMLDDPFGNTDRAEGSIWYQSRFYRADLHLKDDLPYLRDLTLYSDRYPQPYIDDPARVNDVEQRMPAVLDGYHWSATPGSSEPGSGGFFLLEGRRLRRSGRPLVREDGDSLNVEIPLTGGQSLHVRFEERRLSARLAPKADDPLELSFEWDPPRSALLDVQRYRVDYRWQGFDYSIGLDGSAKRTADGWSVTAERPSLSIRMAQVL